MTRAEAARTEGWAERWQDKILSLPLSKPEQQLPPHFLQLQFRLAPLSCGSTPYTTDNRSVLEGHRPSGRESG